MALFLNKDNSEKIVLSEIVFNKDESTFVLNSEDRTSEIFIDYIPIIDDEYNETDFQIHLFTNIYLNAENDVFEVYERILNKRIGWIFPINILESNENDFSENQYLNKYKFVATKSLLKHNQTKIPESQSQNNFKLTDFYHSDTIICIISNKAIDSQEVLNISNYLPSFANFAYYIWNNNQQYFFESQNNLIQSNNRGRRRITIQRTSVDIESNKFLKDLYCIHLKSLSHILLKFHFLYQVIEFLMEENFNQEFEVLLKLYNEKEIGKNDLREQINTISKERGSITSLIKNTNIEQELIVNFKRDCKLLLDSFLPQPNEQLPDLIYDVRNLVVHRYRAVLNNNEHENLLEIITHELEQIINNIIINFKSKN